MMVMMVMVMTKLTMALEWRPRAGDINKRLMAAAA